MGRCNFYNQLVPNFKKWFGCTQCSFSCPYPNGLETHMRAHTGYKLFICSMCGRYSVVVTAYSVVGIVYILLTGKCFIIGSELRKHECRRTASV
ncbi:hypothetical protein EB796_007827 [Bugula neritina]|uniref:C2H2-type domain-containing protein n=1 Tax=Bugula neritina TaxID=10212 RepID=A0A7J7K6P8_BUGNE|nr:hypothetical protein EB796_007827 [Bugula neritina]